ncbi:recombinational DNA repair protein (RecE pathway) [Winogradskyella forsetii]|uniref:recombinational DNA repair protein (RecE pathway) n=1 Tax=Winogradskyella forsetii TaxID=2686077 RepID=UPI0015C05A3A|nr:recombinational DNA repair protein (RecE pathway) [Winogradskyella forsetii]
MTKKKTEVATLNNATPSERFTQAVIKEFPTGLSNEPVELTSFQKKLIQNYFIKVDAVLNEAEQKRLAKSENYRDAVALTWQNVNMNKLALDVVAYSSIGLDPLQKNHISPIPYKNNKTGKYDINLMEGFNGLELKARKYGYDVPDDVIFELKYSTDHFKSKKKSVDNKIESYEFEIQDDFNRGELEGGFYYQIFIDNPEKNKLIVLNRAQIEKRKPKYASAEFWGGEKDEWNNGKKTGKKEKVEGWEEEMFMKTLKRHCWDKINIDSQKIDDHLQHVLQSEAQSNDAEVQELIEENANKKVLTMEVDAEDVEVDKETGEINEDSDFQTLHNQAIEEEAKVTGPEF